MGRIKQKLDNLTDVCYNYLYDREGRLFRVVDASGATVHAYTYDDYGRVLTHNDAQIGVTYAYTYDGSYPDARLTRVRVYNSTYSAYEVFTHDDFGRVKKRILEVGGKRMTNTLTYYGSTERTADFVTQDAFTAAAGMTGSWTYTYNGAGNIASERAVNSTVAGGEILNRNYGYDLLGRLVSANCKDLGVVYTYTYDTCGNLLSKTERDAEGNLIGTDTYTYNTAINGYKDQLVSYNGAAFVYDACGNPTTYRGKNVIWSYGRRMTRYGTNAYYYNGEGVRYRKNNTYYTLDGTRILAEQNGGAYNTYLYGAGGLIGFYHSRTNAFYYYRKNRQGDIVELYTADGMLYGRYIYDPWGKLLKMVKRDGTVVTENLACPPYGDPLAANPFRYRGYYYDNESGFYYLQTRYYDPEIGRFINADSFKYLGADGPIHGMNLYAYCGNNPIMGYDPSGTFWNQIGEFFNNTWNAISDWFSNTFGASASVTHTLVETKDVILGAPSPITVESGGSVVSVVEVGDSSKPISVYADMCVDNIQSSSAGLKLNLWDLTLDLRLGPDATGVSLARRTGEVTSALSFFADFTKFRIGVETSTEMERDILGASCVGRTYNNANISGEFLIILYYLLQTGQLPDSVTQLGGLKGLPAYA